MLRGKGKFPPLLLALIVIFVILAIMPFVTNPYVLSILFFANIFAIAAASWDLLAGFAGQLSFGNVAFYGIGAYSVALLAKFFGSGSSLHILGTPIVSTIVGLMASALLSLGVGFAAVRLRGPYLAVVTFMVAVILQELIIIYSGVTGGQFGLLVPYAFTDENSSYFASLGLLVASLLILVVITRSRYGLYFKAIRDDEIEAQATGINPTKYKLMAFVLSSSFTSLAGSLYVLSLGIVSWDVFGYGSSLLWIEMAGIGGLGTIIGSVVGSYFIQILIESLRFSQTLSLIIFAVIFVLVIRFFPEGILGVARKVLARRNK